MKRSTGWLAVLLLCLSALAHGQYTTVTGTVVDPIGIPYGYGTVLPMLVISAAGTPQITSLNNANYTPPAQPSGLDINGHFVVNVATNATLIPAGSHWNFLVCSSFGALQHAVGRAGVCFQLASAITISGATQDISTQLNAVALPLTYLTSGITLQTSGVNNPSQVLLNLIAGTGISLTTTSSGTTIATTGGSGITGSGAAGTFPIFTASSVLGNSNLSQIGAGVLQLTLPTASNIGGLCSEAGQFQINSTAVVAPDGIYFNPLGTSSNVELCAATVSSGLGTSIGIHAAQGNSSFGGGSINLEAGGSGSNNGAQIIVQGSGSAVGGEAIVTAGAGLTQGADVQISSGGTTGTGAAGNINLTTGVGGTTATDGVIYIQSGDVPFHTAYLYLHAPTFSHLTVPPNNPDTGNNNGALSYCQDCKGSLDGVVSGTIASGSGGGANLFYDGTNWRVFTGFTTNQPVAIQSTVQKTLPSTVNISGGTAGSPVAVMSQSVTMPSAGCPCRALVNYGVNIDATNAGEATFVVSDGTNLFATGSLNTTGSATNFPVQSSDFSPVTYANSAAVTFTMEAATTQGGTTNVHAANANTFGQSTYMRISVQTSN